MEVFSMGFSWRYLPDLIALALILSMHRLLLRWMPEITRHLKPARAVVWLSAVWVILAFAFSTPSLGTHLPRTYWLNWLCGWGIAWGLCLFGLTVVWAALRAIPDFNPRRRALFNAGGAALLAAPVAAIGFGVFIGRSNFQLREVDVPVDGLPKDLDGLRLVQLSDIHLSPFLSERELERAIGMANETRPHVALVTGDLITLRGDPLDACLRQLTRLRSDAGTFGCLGNHEIYAESEDYTTREGARLGLRFLRDEARRLRFGAAEINLAGIDYQHIRWQYLTGAERMVEPACFNILLSHNPDVFPVAAQKGYQLTLSGHTHGGQITVELLHRSLSVSRFFTPYVHGLYQQAGASAYVTRGIGTVGVPARLGAPPEISLIRLVGRSRNA